MKFVWKALLFLLVFTVLMTTVACKETGDETKPPEQTRPQREETADENGYVYEPPAVNYAGEEFNVYTWSTTTEWVRDADETTTPIDAETFYHFCNVEDEIGVIFNIAQKVSGGWGAHTDFIQKVSMLTGADNIDLVCQYSLAAVHGVLQGCYVNLGEVNYINWDAPYWSGDLKDANTLNGRIYYCSGELSRSVIYNMYVGIFNYSHAQAYELGDIYSLVDKGQWTVGKVRELTTNIYEDLNGDEVANVGDRFGIVANKLACDSLQYGCNLPLLVTNEMGELEVNPNLRAETGIDVVNTLRDLLHTNPGGYVGNSSINVPDYTDAMISGNAVFSIEVASYIINTLYASEINYGILPIPKYNEEQDRYHTCLSMLYSMFSIPVVAENYDMSAAVLESLAHDGYANLTPYIFEECLKSRFSKRPEDAKMFDLLRGGIVYEPGRIFENVSIFSIVRSAVADPNRSFVDEYDSNRDLYKKGISDVSFAFS